MPMKSAHQMLRDATREAHERVDAAFGHFDLQHRASYRDFLTAHAQALLPIETWLDAHAAATLISDWPRRKRGDALLADLAAIGGDPPSLTAFACEPTPQGMMGVVYVVEGSRLGGRYIARQLHPDSPRRYLDADQAPGKWQLFLSQLDDFLYEDASRTRAVCGALLAFDRFERAGLDWLKARA
jgi:heme oxygenase (biliverdin-IX-beta and delta-forming)